MSDAVSSFAGATSGVLSAAVVNPLDVARTRMQALAAPFAPSSHAVAPRGPSVVRVLTNIARSEGASGLFAGLGASSLAMPLFGATFFPLLEAFKPGAARLLGVDASSPACAAVAAAAAGAATEVVVAPLWVVRTRLQTQRMHAALASASGRGAAAAPRSYAGVADALASVAREEGLQALWRGLGPSLLCCVHVMVQFPLYVWLQDEYRRRNGLRADAAVPVGALVASAASSKVLASAATYPLEVVRTLLQDARGAGAGCGASARPRGAVALFAELARSRSLYAGFGANLLRAVPSSAVSLTAYSCIVDALRREPRAEA
uniref:Uncharacterized protein n=1 Tax=Bicosoecida sp. CB-2014 TaxID=1486930 RepID=A0A7S1CCN9_9STRA|mmetsp:Transcript_19266/g.68064  ORF Transcript_19266/g.68064 Transcript_19266/m.68064 type:complete len:319 (+) Transcript_19266:196-1152(+)